MRLDLGKLKLVCRNYAMSVHINHFILLNFNSMSFRDFRKHSLVQPCSLTVLKYLDLCKPCDQT